MYKKLFSMLVLVVVTVTAFAQQADWSVVPYRVGDKWGYSNTDQSIIIQPQYEDAGWFINGYAVVKKNGKYGYIDRSGRMVIPAKYTSAKPFRQGYVENKAKGKSDTVLFAGAALKADGFENCINTKGVILKVCPAMNENADPANRGPIETKEKVYTITNSNGLFDKITDDYMVSGNPDNFYIAQKNGMYGVFNNKFEVVTPFEYNSLKQVKVGDKVYLLGQRSNIYGVLNGDGSVMMPSEYSNISYVKGRNNEDYFIVTKDGKSYVRTLDNKDLFTSEYANIDYDINGGFVVTDANGNRGFYYPNNTTVSPKYSEVNLVNTNSGYLKVKTKNGKTGYVSPTGVEYFKD